MGIPAAIEFGKIYAACPTDENPDKICEGAMPFRLFVTIIGALVHVIISYSAYFIFTRRKVGLKHDFFGAFKEDRNGSVVLASSRHMKEEYEMNMTIPRAKVSMTGEGMTAYENNGYK